jgi:hypothetical protein
MLPRNASILLVLMICFAQNIPTHSFYYETESKIDVEISGKRILIKFKSKFIFFSSFNCEDEKYCFFSCNECINKKPK